MSSETHFDSSIPIRQDYSSTAKAPEKEAVGELEGHFVTSIKLGGNDGISVTAKKVETAEADVIREDIQEYEDFDHVLLKDAKGDPCAVKVKELAKTLHLSEKAIRDSAEKGEEKLSQLLHQAGHRESNVQLAKDLHAKLRQPNPEYMQEGEVFEGMTPTELMRQAKQAKGIDEDELRDTIAVAHKTLKIGEATQLRTESGEALPFVAKRIDKDRISILHMHKKLGEGGFGIAHGLRDIRTGDTQEAMKVTKSKAGLVDVQKERQRLMYFNARGPVWGIPKTATHVVRQQGKEVGFLTHRYAGSYKDICKNPNNNADITQSVLLETDQILHGVKHLHDQGYVHRDLKEDNIFYDKTPSGDNALFVSDFGGIKSKEENVAGALTHTATYCLEQELDEASSLVESARGNPEVANAITENAQKRDVFALGTVLYKRLSGGEYPYELLMNLDEDGSTYYSYPIVDENSVPKPLHESIDPGYRQLINDMLNVDPTKRPNMTEVYERFQNLDMTKEHAEFLAQKRAEMCPNEARAAAEEDLRL